MGDCFRFHQKLLICPGFLVKFLLKKYIYMESFAHDLGMKKTSFQVHVISWDKFDKMCGILFLKIWVLGLLEVTKLSHKNDLKLSHVKP